MNEAIKRTLLTPISKAKIADREYVYWQDLMHAVIQEGVTNIGDGAFWCCGSMESIVIPEGVVSIGDYAFWGCSSLKSIVIPEGVVSIGDYAFKGCGSLESIVIPESVVSIGDYAFKECSSLKSIVIPEGVISMGDSAFCECSSLKSIVLPKGVSCVGDYVFYGCSSLKQVTWGSAVHKIQCIDGYCTAVLHTKELDGYKIMKCQYFPENEEYVWVAEKDGFAAHGKTIKEAVRDLEFKRLQSRPVQEHLERILKQGYTDAMDYRLLTGVCEAGTNKFLREHGLTWDDKWTIQEVLELTKGEWGHEKFADAVNYMTS